MQKFSTVHISLRAIAISLTALAIAMGAAGCGESQADKNAKAATHVDRAFVTLSITLNENAIAMSDIAAKDAKSEALQNFAAEVASERRAENEKLADFADQIGADANGGPPSAADLKALGWTAEEIYVSADGAKLEDSGDIDEAYGKLLRQNIDGSFRVARPEVIKGKVTQLVDFAKQQISDRTLELEQLEEVEKAD